MKTSCYHKTMAEMMRADPTFARDLTLQGMKTGLAKTIWTMGVDEFSSQSGIKKQAVSDFVQGKREFRPKTLDRCLSVFGLPPVFSSRQR